jgi:carbonic anhydrase/acetyltransferase-like protein (isoleucine patch superfamily)
MLIPYLDFIPTIAPSSDCAPTAAIVGRTTTGPGLTLRHYATLRADGNRIELGANVYCGERSTVHIADEKLPALIGNDVTVGRYALVHACTIADRVVVGDLAVVMDGAEVGAGALIATGSLVPPRKRLAGGWVYDGSPATPVREIDPAELSAAALAIRNHTPSTLVAASTLPPLEPGGFFEDATAPRGGSTGRAGDRAFIAPTATLAGNVVVDPEAGIYFGCALIARDTTILIGPRTNVQDNSLLITDAKRGVLVVGAEVTIGHNVRIGAATIGDRALIGMGSELGDGVVVEPGGCVGARAFVEPRTVVAGGWIWAGRPARAFRELTAVERQIFAHAASIYVRYGANYRRREGALEAVRLSPCGGAV